MSLLFYLFSSATNLWHRKFITADVTAMFVNTRHDIQWPGQGFDFKKTCIWRGTQQILWQTNVLRKAGQGVVLISCWKSCETRAQLTRGQAAADRAVKRKYLCLRMLNISNILLTYKYTHDTQLHA